MENGNENNNAAGPKVYKEVIFPGTVNNVIADQYDIVMVAGDGTYKNIYSKSHDHRTEAVTMHYIIVQLDPAVFLRSHRSYILNIRCVKSFEPGKKRLHVKMTDGSSAFVCEEMIAVFMEMYKALN